jgi:hypothetical protein
VSGSDEPRSDDEPEDEEPRADEPIGFDTDALLYGGTPLSEDELAAELDQLEAQKRQIEEAERAKAEKDADEDELRKLDLAAARRRERRAAPREPGRPTGAVAIPKQTFLRLLQLAVDGASGHAMEKATIEEPGMSFVNRHKAGDLKKWVDDHPGAARTALAGNEIPRSFVTSGGDAIIPKRRSKP